MAAEFSLRSLRLSDLSRVAELERACNPQPWNQEALRAYAVENTAPENRCVGLAAENLKSGGVVGYLCAQQGFGEAEILIFGVDPLYRRQGVGRILIDALMENLRARSCPILFLEVRRSNIAAISLYRASGFSEVGFRKGYYADTGEDAVLMRKEFIR